MTRSLGQWIGFGAALLLLNLSLSFHNVWPTLWIEARPELSVEIAALVLLLGLYRRLVGRLPDGLLAFAAAVLLLMTLGRYMEVTAPALFGRAVNLYWDAQYLPDVAAMLAGSAPIYLTITVVGGLVLALAAVFWMLRWSLTCVRRALDEPRSSRGLQAVAAGLVALYFLGYYTPVPSLGWFSIPVSHTYARQFSFVASAMRGTDPATLPDESPLGSIDLGARPRGDVIVTFVESYGATAFDAEPVASLLDEPRRRLADAIARSGREVVSAYIEAPTFGGASWRSHASFMSGIEISDDATYNVLLTQSRPTLPSLFNEAGYRTAALMPGLRNEWPEGSFYGFDIIYGAARLDYRGPEFGWWRIPDQFALARLDEWELSPADRDPAFVFFPTISTHMPFRPTPPYQADWQRIGSAVPYTPEELGERLSHSPEWTNLRPAYAGTLDYTYAYWGGYLAEHADRDFLLVLLGDHQPPSSISGEGARWDVPVHVITRDTPLVGRLVAHGFRPGLTPAPAAVARMHELGVMLLK